MLLAPPGRPDDSLSRGARVRVVVEAVEVGQVAQIVPKIVTYVETTESWLIDRWRYKISSNCLGIGEVAVSYWPKFHQELRISV